MEKIIQLEDDIELLNKLIQEQNAAHPFYKPTQYWDGYQQSFVPELMSKGLKNFRRRRGSILGSFGATDLPLLSLERIPDQLLFLNKIRFLWRAVPYLRATLEFLLIPSRKIFYECSMIHPERIFLHFYKEVEKKFAANNLSLDMLSYSLIGNPDETFERNGKCYSLRYLEYAYRFIEAYKFLEFMDGDVLCELGPGGGRNAEIFADIFPNSTILLFDIVPQLYVLNQYFKKRFKQRFLSCEEARALNPNSPESFKGKILLLPAWLMPEWKNFKINLFWNSESFQEMEPHVVKNYLDIVKEMNPKSIYINALPEGVLNNSGFSLTEKPVTQTIYQEELRDQYYLSAQYESIYFLRGDRNYQSYIFQHNNGKEE